MWYTFFVCSVAVLLLTLALSVKVGKINSGMSINVLIAGVFVAIALMFAPIYVDYFASDILVIRIIKTVLISLHHAIRLFIVDSDFDIIKNSMGESAFFTLYSSYATVMYVLAPVLTFGFVLSFFKNISAYKNYLFSYKKDVYVFSEINKKSVALGKSIAKKYPKAAIVYASAAGTEDVEVNDFPAGTKIINFKKDLLSVKFNLHSKKKEIRFFIIGDNEAENVKQSLKIIEIYKDRDNTWAYVFSNKIEGETVLSSVDKGALKLRRISDVRTLVYSILESSGERLFAEAISREEGGDKLVSALVIGLSGCGAEMVKSLAWFGQMTGYRIEITAMDERSDAEDKFASLCPELMAKGYNNNFEDPGEAQYSITVNQGVSPEKASFYEEITKLKAITYVLVDAGDDETNIGVALKIRSLLARNGISPVIQAVVHDSERVGALKDVKNYSGQSFDIEFVGDVDSFYTVDNIMNSKLEAEALARHLKWGNEDAFWNFEYNRRASLASALHRRMKLICGVPGADKATSDRNEEEKNILRMLEHRRWNAYMRSEGYTFAEKRNNMAKTHNCLVTFDALTPEEKAKDDD